MTHNSAGTEQQIAEQGNKCSLKTRNMKRTEILIELPGSNGTGILLFSVNMANFSSVTGVSSGACTFL